MSILRARSGSAPVERIELRGMTTEDLNDFLESPERFSNFSSRVRVCEFIKIFRGQNLPRSSLDIYIFRLKRLETYSRVSNDFQRK